MSDCDGPLLSLGEGRDSVGAMSHARANEALLPHAFAQLRSRSLAVQNRTHVKFDEEASNGTFTPLMMQDLTTPLFFIIA